MFHSLQLAIQAQIRHDQSIQTSVRLLGLDEHNHPRLADEVQEWRADAIALKLTDLDLSREKSRASYALNLQPKLLSSHGEIAISALLALLNEPIWANVAHYGTVAISMRDLPMLLLENPSKGDQVLYMSIEKDHIEETPVYCPPCQSEQSPWFGLAIAALTASSASVLISLSALVLLIKK